MTTPADRSPVDAFDPVQTVMQVLYPGTVLTPTAFREILTPPPRALQDIEAELLFKDGQIILHTLDAKTKAHVFKVISPQAAAIAFNQQQIDSGWLDGIVRHGSQLEEDWAVLFTPPTRRGIALQCDQDFRPPEATQQIVIAEVPFPGAVFMVKGQKTWMWCLKGDTFDPNAKAYLPPLPNVDSNGYLCFGSNTKPAGSAETIHRIHEIWWEGVFTSHQVEKKSSKYPDDVRPLLWEVQALKRYPTADLNGGRSTIATLVQKVIDAG